MFEVLAIRTVLSINGLPVLGSSRNGNSVSTSVISLPRSPHPMYTTMSASAHLANCCWVTVLPDPKGPGIAAAPPLATEKKVSCALCPVTNGTSGSNFSM